MNVRRFGGLPWATLLVPMLVALGVSERPAYPAGTIERAPANIQPPGKACDNERFVSQLYLDLLGRPGDPPGLNALLAQLKGGATRSQVALVLIRGQEFRSLQVQALYRSLLGRSADPAALNAFTTLLQQGGTFEQVEVAILSSPEYFQIRGGGTNDAFVQGLYKDVLGRQVDPAGRAQFDQMLARGGSRSTVATAVAGSAEAKQRRVRVLYGRFLQRAPGGTTPAAFGGQSDDQVLAGILGSDAYCARLGPGRAGAAPQPLGTAAPPVEKKAQPLPWRGRQDDKSPRSIPR